jgi:hypothetical protein
MQKKSWGTCEVVYSHNFIRPNTVFEVGRGNCLVTTYTDKHPTYEFLNGPSGVGLSQGYFPEVSSVGSHSTAQEAWDDLHCKLPYGPPPVFISGSIWLTFPGLLSVTGSMATSPTAPKPRRRSLPLWRELPSNHLGSIRRRIPSRQRLAPQSHTPSRTHVHRPPSRHFPQTSLGRGRTR